uniref:Signal peptidase complex subunit 1 n=1 Tax=Mus musculus TaxID=10090 RepID=A0A2I3BQG3_MOUSE
MLEHLSSLPTQMDYKGQKLAEQMFQGIILFSAIVGFIYGYVAEQFGWTVYIVMAGFAFSCLVSYLWYLRISSSVSFLTQETWLDLPVRTRITSLFVFPINVSVLYYLKSRMLSCVRWPALHKGVELSNCLLHLL